MAELNNNCSVGVRGSEAFFEGMAQADTLKISQQVMMHRTVFIRVILPYFLFLE